MTILPIGYSADLPAGQCKCSRDVGDDTKKDKCDEVIDTVDETADHGESLAECTTGFVVLWLTN